MLLGFLLKSLPTLLLLTLTSSPASGNPIPPQTVNNPSAIEAHSSDSHGGGLKSWQLVLLVLGSILGIMLIGGLGGACEVLLHAKRIKQSNAEADAKVEAGGNKALDMARDVGDDGSSGSDAATEVEVTDDSGFSWQREKLTGVEDPSKNRALSRSETSGSSQTTLNGGQGSVDSDARLLPWEDPALAQFVIGDEEDLDHDGEEAVSHDHQKDHSAQSMGMPHGYESQHKSTDNHHERHNDDSHRGAAAFQDGEPITRYHERSGQALVVAPVRAYSDGEYSPAVMPDEADYLAEYRQSQLYLQQEDDWQQYYDSRHGANRSESHQVGGHDVREVALSKPDQGQH
ncbi:hypothetical protein VPNG_09673 [Cytospora leucostoma]|uniref:Transmembrane protein n=1 Tax=Cytospora leucostoma TaxID=1230097 RepID=A0A423VMH0_9PEZI|nr:hypothetical protein VPNG_09673 [Cytospora leucostoma]